jgi:hypothetical protein
MTITRTPKSGYLKYAAKSLEPTAVGVVSSALCMRWTIAWMTGMLRAAGNTKKLKATCLHQETCYEVNYLRVAGFDSTQAGWF